MNKYILLYILIFANCLLSQPIYYFEPIKSTGIEVNGNFGEYPDNDWDIAVDNFGMHFIGLYGLTGYDGKGILKYSLVDNNGIKIDGNNDIGSNGQNITAAAITCYKGKVYIILASQIQTKIKIYVKNNQHPINSIWNFVDQYDAGSSGSLYNNPKTMDVTADDYGLHIVYGFSESSSTGNIYYLNYKLNENRWANFNGGPRIKINGTNGSKRPQIVTTKKNNIERVHISHSYSGINTRDIIFNSYDDVSLMNEISTNSWGTGIYGNIYTGFEWSNIISDPNPNGKLYDVGTLSYYDGVIYVDSRLKSRDVETQSWTVDNGVLNEYDYINTNFPQSAFYDTFNPDKIAVCYGFVTGIGLEQRVDVEYKEFKIINNAFDNASRRILFDPGAGGGGYGSCIMKADSQGVYVAVFKGSNPKAIEMRRKPREFRNNLKYNALFSGNTYFNAPLYPYCRTDGADAEASNNSITKIKYATNLYIDPNDYINFRAGSCLQYEQQAKILPEGGNLIYETNCITWQNQAANVASNGSTIRISQNLGAFTVNNGGYMVVGNGCTLEVQSGSYLLFDGAESKLTLLPGSTVKFGQNCTLEFKNGAYIEANGSTFTNLYQGEGWNGVVLDGAGSQSYIQNCIFNNASKSIIITNSVCNITGNVFNAFNTTYGYGIEAINVNSITIQNNIFNALQNSTYEGIRFFNYEADGLPGGAGVPVYSLNVVGNTFNGGTHPIEFLCVTAAQLPFYVANNTFNPVPGGIYDNYGVFAYNITGDIKNNTFNLYGSTYLHRKAFTLEYCTVNLYNNNLKSGYQTIWTNNSTIMQIAPIQNSNGQWVWVGGYNQLRSDVSYNIEFQGNSNPIISPNGRNCFTVNTQPNNNLYGYICLGPKPYYAYDNFWSPAPSSNSFNIICNGNPVNVVYTPNLTTCPIIDPDAIIDQIITDLGNGIFDTVYVTSDGGEGGSGKGEIKAKRTTVSIDKILYYNAIQKRKQKDYADAINKCKELINNHDTSIYFNSALSELYLNYLNSDTTGNQTITNGLFSNLKTYIEQKMQQYQSNAQFIERAYKYLLMCLVKIKSYSEAVAGYENIMNNHPDPIVRLNASWDRSAVVFMMGQGGSENEKSVNNSKSKNKKLLDKNPAHRIAKDIFKVQKEESDRIETENELYGDNTENKNRIVYTKEEKRIFESRIDNYNPVNQKEFIEKLSGDIKVMEQVNTAKTTNKVLVNIPKTYKLYQNYPNPFNPTTSIKYEIPKNAQVTIKVYDILGKEVFSLNEYKLAGSYEVKFDGSNLASGMYFYSFNANGYKDVKKMVLLK